MVFCLGCRKETVDGAAPSSSSGEWIDFEGIQYRAPAGTQQLVKDGVLPGPGGLGGIPSGQRIHASISKPNPNGLFVELLRTADPVTLEGMKSSLVANGIARHLVGKTTTPGWELTYEQIDGADASIGEVHIVYADLGGKHYQCTWAETNCADKKAADGICRSLRAKR